ncbi:NUDIX hydrolase [Aristophania vespae]|uniref:NUDIX hydrolase n=1 Tax=Aristophania vespae TaxID=2697033 RepID=UPI002351292C|nr:NUDIX domain-containing protein [Aristophania vespae]UMM63405.1 hypothetical protein DM15PD_03670 [Aristophania vespae]
MRQVSDQAMPFLRHIKRCHNALLPGGRINLRLNDQLIGYIDPAFTKELEDNSLSPYLHIEKDGIRLKTGEAFRIISESLGKKNAYLPFDELFDVRTFQGDVVGQVDRALIPLLGLEAQGVHVNGLVKKNEKIFLWVAKRSAHKRLDPGKLDHIVAGGMNAGGTPDETVKKEAAEEASIPSELAEKAYKASIIHYAMARSEGLRRDRLHCYDLYLPENFIPRAADGEVESFALWPLEDVFDHVRNSDNFKFNVNLVLIDLFLRHNFFQPDDERLLRDALFFKN